MFNKTLKTGLIGEGEIARWFVMRGYSVLPAYEVEIDSGKGPRLYTNIGPLVSPDMLVFKESKTIWIEAKTKSAFTWYRKAQRWQTGIDLRHWNEYLKVNEKTPFPVWILFLHRLGNKAKDTPDGVGESPSGLFAGEVIKLKNCFDHISHNHGRSGMIYWNVEDLQKIKSYIGV